MVFLLVMMSFTSISGIQINENIIKSSDRGDILYVGGSGEGNYTTIQSAINDAVDGDTVFVFDDSSPYYENITIDKSINLIGEDKNTTVLDGSKDNYTIYVFYVLDDANEVTITGFTIIETVVAIYIYSNYNTIINNNIFGHQGIRVYNSIGNNISNNKFVVNYGIIISDSNENTINNNYIINGRDGGISLGNSSNNIVSKNTIVDMGRGISISGKCENNHINNNILNNITYRCVTIGGKNNSVYNNIISNSEKGIVLRSGSKNNDIYENEIKSCDVGIELWGAISNNIHRNNIINCYRGVYCYFFSYYNKIYENNFIKNIVHGEWTIYFREIPLIYSRNIWDKNYWGRPLLLPKFVKGYIRGYGLYNPFYYYAIPSYRIDWHPAKEPYDITTAQGCDII
jgi:parallel beta-helix repeat protein